MLIQVKDTLLVFIRSRYVKAFPCSRRRSTLIDGDGNNNTVQDRYYIPFDPESRLNTEANNRKHSGLNGYKQNYIYDWDSLTGHLSVVLAGYLFDIQLLQGYTTPVLFGQQIEKFFNNFDKIFINIRVDDVTFFSGAGGLPAAYTKILRNQTATDVPSSSLDTLIDGLFADDPDNYYFSGLSFSPSPIVDSGDNNVISLCLLEKIDGIWRIHEQSKLPVIDHGSKENSVKVNILEADHIYINGNEQSSSINIAETGNNIFQLQLTTG